MHWLIDAFGVIGNILFGVGCVPAAYRALRDGKTAFPVDSAWIIGGACAFFYTYLIAKYGLSWMTTPLGVVEVLSYAIVLYHHYIPRNSEPKPVTMEEAFGIRCTREVCHDGPCNGYPKIGCPGYINWLHRAINIS